MAKLKFLKTLSKPALKGLTIAASTVAVVELLKQNYSVGISASISWLLLVISLKRKTNGQTANNADISFRNIPIPEKCEWHMHAID